MKQPYYIHMQDKPLVFAGLCDTWHKAGPEGNEALHSCTILTTESSKRLKWLHDRMPVVLPDAAACKLWLTAPQDKALELCKPFERSELVWHAVTPSMNKPSYQEVDCAKPLKVATMASFFSKTSKPAAAADKSKDTVASQEGERQGVKVKDDGVGKSYDAQNLMQQNAEPPSKAAKKEGTPEKRKRTGKVADAGTPGSAKKGKKLDTGQEDSPTLQKFFPKTK